MASIVTYDVPEKHGELKDELFTLGYLDQIPGTKCEIIYLPYTTLYHETKTPKEAVKDVRNICKSLKIKLERCVATIWSQSFSICGEPSNNH
jgi:hypothetical protein